MPDAPAPTENAPAKRRTLVDLTPLRASRAYARLWAGSAIAGIGAQLTIVAVGLQIYAITRDTFAVALVGGIALVPMVVAGVWGGMLADAFDRRRVLLVSAIVAWCSTLGLVALSATDAALTASGAHVAAWPFYVFTTINTVAATIQNATRSAVTPRILPAELVSRAAALNGISIGVQLTLGPALAGVLVAGVGFWPTFAVDAVLFSAAFVGILGLPRMPPLASAARPGLQSLRDGVAFLRTAPTVRMSFIVDIVAMTFGRPIVLLPAVGATVIGGGPITVGVLVAAAAVGTFLTSLFSGPVGHVHRHGLAVARAITVYGAFVLAFGTVVGAMQTGWFGPVGPQLSQVNWPALALAAVAMAGTGASDEVSAIFRSTILLTAAPDEMRGRLQGIFTVVVGGGPRIGDLYAGILASLVALWFPPALGGILIMAVIAVLLRMQPAFRRYDARHPTP